MVLNIPKPILYYASQPYGTKTNIKILYIQWDSQIKLF